MTLFSFFLIFLDLPLCLCPDKFYLELEDKAASKDVKDTWKQQDKTLKGYIYRIGNGLLLKVHMLLRKGQNLVQNFLLHNTKRNLNSSRICWVLKIN